MSEIVVKRRESMYLRAISDIIANELTNANLSITTVTGVKLSRDGSHINVFVVFENNKEKSLEALENAKGYIRSQLARLGNQRIVPQLHFIFDETHAQANRIEEILQSIKNKQKD